MMMKKLWHLINKVEMDKWAHLFVCLLIVTSIGFWVSLTFNGDTDTSIIIGALSAIALGIAKEIRDSHIEGNFFSWEDFLADIIGTAIGAVLVLIFG